MAIPLAVAAGIMTGGGIGSALTGSSERDQMNRNISQARGDIQNIMNQIPGQSQEIQSYLEGAYSPYTQNAAGDMTAYRDAISQAGNLQYGSYDPFAYDLQSGIQKFMDPSLDLQIKKATGAVEGSAANTGKLFSSSTGKAISDRAQELSQLAWKDALKAAMEDRGFQYGVYGDDITRDRQAIDFQLKQQGQKLDSLGNLAGMGQQATTNLASSVGDVKLAEMQGLNDLALSQAQLGMQRPGGSAFGDFLSGVAGGASILGPIMGGKE